MGWGCFFAAVVGWGCFFVAVVGWGWFAAPEVGWGCFAVVSALGLQQFCVKPFVGHVNLIYAADTGV